PQTSVPGVRHSTFESLRLGRSSESIVSNLFASGIPRTSRKTLSLWESRFSSLMKKCGWANLFCPGLRPYQRNNSSRYPSPH
ncbi:hypothetical protein HID58_047574, partial [Brassica napus]